MCAPTQLYTGLSSAIGLVSSIAKDKRDEKINEYKTQIAINNIENNKLLASQQLQQGIESAHQTKIKGMSAAATQMAKNASNGFDMNSMTNLYNIDDIYNSADSEANLTKEEYLLKAQNYINSANNQILSLNASNEANSINRFLTGMNYLGSATKVAESWSKEDSNGDIQNTNI